VTLLNLIEDGPISNADGSPNTTTIHFHGIREVGRTDQTEFGPWSDGVPYVNQCPVEKGQTFTYFFHATRENRNAPPGTYWYHSHVGAQRTNGLEGVVVIRPKDYTQEETNRDFVIAVQEWYESMVNGKGRVSTKKFDCDDSNEVNKFLRGLGGNFHQVEYLPTKRRQFTTNYESFKIESFGTYRLRIAGLIGQNFPIRFSAELCVGANDSCTTQTSLTHTAIAADSLDIEPIENLRYTWVAAAKRFDVQIDTTPINTCGGYCFIRLQFIGFTNLYNNTQSNVTNTLCSAAYIWHTYEPNYYDVLSPKCSEYDTTPFPDFVRTLNPPSKNHTMFFGRVRDPHDDPTETGHIYPVDIRSKLSVDTSQVNYWTNITFHNVSTFNNIRTTWPDTPYLLQNPSLSKTEQKCDDSNKDDYIQSFTSHVNPSSPLTTNISICQHVLQYEYLPGGWVETVLINRDHGANHPIHQHGGWYWVVGEGQFPSTPFGLLDPHIVLEGLRNGSLKRNQDHSAWYGDSLTALPKDVIQVPNYGYVVIRTPLDNPGNWIFHCHIDFHLSIGMGLVLQIGEQGDWYQGPYWPSTENQMCKGTPPTPFGSPKTRINWFLHMIPAHRCVVKGETVTFYWMINADSAFGHNVNHWYEGNTETIRAETKEAWDKCNFTMYAKPFYPSFQAIDPNYIFDTTNVETGIHYFACSLGYNETIPDNRFHCNRGVKATVKVVDDIQDCDMHHF